MTTATEANAQVPAEAAAKPETLAIHPLTDLGNAYFFAQMFKDEAAYVPELDKWLVWSEGKWISSKIKLMGLVKKLLGRRREEARHLGDLKTHYGEHVDKAQAARWVNSSQSKSKIDAMLHLATMDAGIMVLQEAWDSGKFLLGMKNGVLDLRTGEVRPGRPGDYITQSLGTEYDPSARCPGWINFIGQVTCGRQDLAEYIQEVLGYALCGSVQEQQMYVFTGKGANGKSTLVDVFLDLMGDYGKTTPSHSLMKSESRAIRNDIARLRGARFVSAVEINSGKQLDEALVKRLTGGDKVTARFIGKEFFEFEPQAKFFLAVNTLPEVSGADDGIYRRLRIVPFDLSVAEDHIVKDMADKLKVEAAGILAWAVEGFRRWYERGRLVEPACVRESSSDFRSVMDTIGSFLADRCERKTESRIPKATLFAEYRAWAEEACIEPVGRKQFGTLIRQQGFKESKSGDTRYWKGLGQTFRHPSGKSPADPESMNQAPALQ